MCILYIFVIKFEDISALFKKISEICKLLKDMLEFYPNNNSGLMQGQCETVLQTSINCNGRTGDTII